MAFDTGTVWSRVQFHLSQRFIFMKPDAQHKPSGGWGNLWPMPKKSNLSDWSRCRVLFLNGSWLIMHRHWNWPTVIRLHSAVYNMCGTWEPKIWTLAETLFGEVRGWKWCGKMSDGRIVTWEEGRAEIFLLIPAHASPGSGFREIAYRPLFGWNIRIL